MRVCTRASSKAQLGRAAASCCWQWLWRAVCFVAAPHLFGVRCVESRWRRKADVGLIPPAACQGPPAWGRYCVASRVCAPAAATVCHIPARLPICLPTCLPTRLPARLSDCLQSVMRRFNLRANSGPQTYALGLKEVWEVRTSTRSLWQAGAKASMRACSERGQALLVSESLLFLVPL